MAGPVLRKRPVFTIFLLSLTVIPMLIVVVSIVLVLSTHPQKVQNTSQRTATGEASDNYLSGQAKKTEQKNDILNIITSINEYIANSNGKLPGSYAELQSAVESAGTLYTPAYKEAYTPSDVPASEYDLYYYGGYTCDGDVPPVTGALRQFAIVYRTPDGELQCLAN